MIDLTESAVLQIDTLCKENNAQAVMLAVKGGGCAGFEYEWSLITNSSEQVNETDEFITENFVVEGHSVMYLIGSTVNYKKDIMGAMFEIINPNAQSSCGCGVSINFDPDMLRSY